MQMNPLEDTGERMVPEMTGRVTFWEHVYRYRFSASYVRNKRVLDIACGEGYGTSALEQGGASSVIGVDISPETCKHANLKYGVDARVGDATNIPLPDQSVDVIVSFETIEHLLEPEKFVKECRRVLASAGRMIISTPNKDIYRAEKEPNEFHFQELNRDEFICLLRKYFSKVRIFSQQPSSVSWVSLRPLSLQSSPWFQIRGMWRLHKILERSTCPRFKNVDDYRENIASFIQQKDNLLSGLVNPYRVTREVRDESAVYLTAVVDI